jgi:alpha-L-rhamnosidase
MQAGFDRCFKWFVLPAVVALSLLAQPPTPAFPEHLQVENRTDPLGIDVLSPRLSWNLNPGPYTQRAYRVRAASASDLLNHDTADLWDSGMVESSHSSGIAYRGTLQSRQRVFWQVRVWTDSQPENPSPWTVPVVFEMGLLNPADWAGQWIAHPSWTYGQPLPIFARQFTAQKPVRSARLYVTGLGVYVVTLNGRPVTDGVLAPGNTTFAKRVEYATYDITAQPTCKGFSRPSPEITTLQPMSEPYCAIWRMPKRTWG